MKTTARVLLRVTSWETADEALRRLAQTERRTLKAKGGADKRIERVKAQLKGVLKPLAADWKRLLGQLERYTVSHPDDLQERTRRLTHGTVRLYKTPDAIISDLTDDEVVALLKRHYPGLYVRTKEAPDRVAMKALSAADLALVGCRLDSHDEFQWQLPDETEWR